ARNAAGTTDGPIWSFTTNTPVPLTDPTNPSPADTATGVAENAALTWSATGASSYDVAFAPSTAFGPLANGLTGASVAPTMAPGTTYTWRVTARNAAGTATGPLWSFTTVPAPADLLVFDTFTGTGPLP